MDWFIDARPAHMRNSDSSQQKIDKKRKPNKSKSIIPQIHT